MNIQFTLAWRYLTGRPLRTTLTTLAVVFGVLVLFGMNIILPAFLLALQANVMAASGQVDIAISHRAHEAFVPTRHNDIAQLEGVRAVTGLLSRAINLPANFVDSDPATPDRLTAFNLVGVDAASITQIRAYPLEAGRFLAEGERGVAVISRSLADQLGLEVGEALRLPTAQGITAYEVVGIRPPHLLPGNEEVIVALADAQTALALPGQINSLEVALNTLEEATRTRVETQVRDLMGEAFTLNALSSGSELFAGLVVGQAVISAFGVLALVMGGFIIFNTFRTVVAERRRDLAMLRAVGASRATVLTLILAESVIQGVLGTLIGVVLGYGMGALILTGVRGVVQQFINITVGAPVVEPGLLALSVGLGLGVTVAAGLWPAFTATSVSPLEALRPTIQAGDRAPVGKGTWAGVAGVGLAGLVLLSGNAALVMLGGLLLLVGLLLVAPALVHPLARVVNALIVRANLREATLPLAAHNLTRQTTRAAITASATIIGMALIVAAGGMVSSLMMTFDDVLRSSLGSDYILVPPAVAVWASNVGADDTLTDRLRALDEVAVVSSLRFAASTTPASGPRAAGGEVGISVLGLDPATFPQVSSLAFEAGDENAYAELGTGRVMIVNGPMAANLGARVGSVVPLLTPTGWQEYRIIAIANDYLNAKLNTAYLSHANLQADFNRTDDVLVQFNLRPTADRAAAETRLRALVADYPQFTLISGQAYYEQNAQLLNQSFGAMYILFAVLAVPSLIALLNTLAIAVIERTREIGLMRAVGATRAQIGRLVVFEAVLLAGFGTGLGVLAGLYLSQALVGALSLAGFTVQFRFPGDALLAALALGMLFGVLAAWLPARQAARLDVIESLRL